MAPIVKSMIRAATFFLVAQAKLAHAFWPRASKSMLTDTWPVDPQSPDLPAASLLAQNDKQVASSFDSALRELKQLESAPLCHRVAARLLVNDCKLLEGRDEATIHTASGRQIQDFVDSYAASLAICDLERANFVIPHECDKFRESSLRQVAVQASPHLPFTHHEITECMTGLGAVDAAWTTWVSYKHKAQLFCHAAQADNTKDQQILAFQEVTKVMSNLVHEVDRELGDRMKQFNMQADTISDKLENLGPQVERVHDKLFGVEDFLEGDFVNAVKKSSGSVNDSIQKAQTLQKLLENMWASIHNSHAEALLSQEHSLQQVNQQYESQTEMMMAIFQATAGAASALHNQIEHASRQVSDLDEKHERLEQAVNKIGDAVHLVEKETIANKYLVGQAKNMTNDLLDILETANDSAMSLGHILLDTTLSSTWWPYIWCPLVSLVVGSYGLPPSFARNMGLFVFGEFVGYAISSAQVQSLGIRLNTSCLTRYLWFGDNTPVPTTMGEPSDNL